MGFGIGEIIGGIGSIANMFDDSAEDAEYRNYQQQLQAYNDAKRYTDTAVNSVNQSKDWRYNNLMDITNKQRSIENNAYNDYKNLMVPGNQNINNQFKDYYNTGQGMLTDQYGNAINTQDTSLQNAINSLNVNYNAGDVAGDTAMNPYNNAIQDRLGQVSNSPAINYDNDPAYAEAQRKAMEDMNQQLLARGEFNSSEGLRQNQELIRDMNLSNEKEDYNRAVQLAGLESNKTGDINNLVSGGLNVANTGSNLGNTNRQLGTSLADMYMNQGQNVSNIYTGLGNTTGGAAMSMGQDLTNLSSEQLANLVNRNQQNYQTNSNIYSNQLAGGQDIYNNWANQNMGIANNQNVTSTGQNFGNTVYDNAGNTAAANTTNRTNLFSNLGTLFGSQTNPATSGRSNTKVNDTMTGPSGETYNTSLAGSSKLKY